MQQYLYTQVLRQLQHHIKRKYLIALWLCLFLGTACNFPYAFPFQSETSANSTNIPNGNVSNASPTAIQLVQTNPTLMPTAVLAAVPTNTEMPVVPVTAGTLPTLVPSPIIVTQAPPVPTQPTPTLFNEPQGCEVPPSDYSRHKINGQTLNGRTITMLQHAQQLYGGTIQFAGWAVTQGSYNPGGVTASFGTHDGGGAVDIAVRDPRTGIVLKNDLLPAVHALRIAGFAAWVREPGELYANSPIHIHAIAIGDTELSPAAQEQLTGKYGYFLGYNGLPQISGVPIPDRYGGPILCNWMVAMGYSIQLQH